jgi:hypothetical protein
MPGTDPHVQAWFKGAEKVQIAFDNALFKAEQDIAAGRGTSNCSALRDMTSKILAVLPKLAALPAGGALMAAQYTPPVQQFAEVAAQCASGNFAQARALLGDESSGAIAAYGKAQEQVDEILDAGA